MIKEIEGLKKYVNHIKSTELNEYALLQAGNKAYNKAIDDVIKLLNLADISVPKGTVLCSSIKRCSYKGNYNGKFICRAYICEHKTAR